MRDFQIYIADDRYAVRSLLFLAAEDEDAIRLEAERLLAEPFHRNVEVWDRGARLFSIGEASLPRDSGSAEVRMSRKAIHDSLRVIRDAPDGGGALISGGNR